MTDIKLPSINSIKDLKENKDKYSHNDLIEMAYLLGKIEVREEVIRMLKEKK